MNRSLANGIALAALASCGYPQGQGPGPFPVGAARTGTLSGTVTDPAGTPIPGALVVTDPYGYETAAGDDGAFEVDRLPPGQTSIVASSPGFTTTESGPVQVVAGDQVDVTVVLDLDGGPPAPELDVTLIGPDDLPFAGATVSVGLASATSDSAGVAVLTGLAAGPVDVAIDATGLSSRLVRGYVLPSTGTAHLSLPLSAGSPADAEEIGTQACTYCHPTEAATHAASGHGGAAARSTTAADAAFSGGWTVDLGEGATARFALDGTTREVVLTDVIGAEATYLVNGWVGDARSSSVPWTDLGADSFPLPVAWIATDPDRALLAEGQAHVAPFETSRWLDGAGALRVPAPSESAQTLCLGCHVTGFRATLRGDGGVDLVSSWPFSPDPRFADPIVGCERCHGPGSTHSQAAIEDKPWTIVIPDRLDRDVQQALCGSCHSHLVSLDGGLPWAYVAGGAYRPGDDLAAVAVSSPVTWPSGLAAVSAEQADELAASPHGTGAYALGCLDCHDPHGTAGFAPLLRADPDDPSMCLGCHLQSSFAGDAAAAEAHTGHVLYDPVGLGSGRCVGCHMARSATATEYGADGGGGRISSHAVTAPLPQDSLDAFDAASADVLPLGAFPPDPCLDCHVNVQAVAPEAGAPAGDPTLRTTHQRLQDYATGMFP